MSVQNKSQPCGKINLKVSGLVPLAYFQKNVIAFYPEYFLRWLKIFEPIKFLLFLIGSKTRF